jgi:3-deoxy-7-phosphoheptulonate synthase
MEELPLGEAASALVSKSRNDISRVLHGEDDRLITIVGPCSVHDPVAGLDYAQRLAETAKRFEDDLLLVMRIYFEKPRTTVGWKGLINDPRLDGSFQINEGLHRARRFLLDVLELGLPTGTEFLDPISSGLSMPVGFKNGTDGTIQIAIDAIRSAANPHHFLSVTKQGVAAIVSTKGNPDCHVILRGGVSGPNYSADAVAHVVEDLESAGLPGRLMVDCSHANSDKDHLRQPVVVSDLAGQIGEGSGSVCGVMLESFLVDGSQNHESGEEQIYGMSITDKCMSWERTEPLFTELAEAVRKRRR